MLTRQPARLQRADLPQLIAMAGFGAVDGPLALAWGLQHTSGNRASLMLTLEALFTAVLAWRLERETMDGAVWTAMALLGAMATSARAVACGEPLPSALAAAVLFAIAATGHGLSLRFYLLAQRAFAAARTGSVFAFAPFIGAAMAVALGGIAGSFFTSLAGTSPATT